VKPPERARKWPRISIVTAVYNGEQYLEETIRSILDQDYPNLEYVIVDDGSTDGTREIIQKYEKRLTWWTSQKNQGMYRSLNTGFAHTTGELMGWLNAADKLHTASLFAIGRIFDAFSEVEWITGHPTLFNEEGMTAMVMELARWSRYRFLAGANRTIQQESTYWRRSLWDKAGARVDDSGKYGHASDFELWVRFFRHASIYSADVLIGGFRSNRDSRTMKDPEACYRMHDAIVNDELDRIRWGKPLKLVGAMTRALKPIPIVRGAWRLLVTENLYHRRGRDWAPVIEFWDEPRFRRE
jgi:glycosyltransferase involved in cell wall biosynthesis